MTSIGLRELKNRLSEYVRRVRAGETVLITDRGQVVAALAPPETVAERRDLPPGLLELACRGLIRLGKGNDPSAYPEMPPTRMKLTSRQLLDQERGER